MAKITIFGWVGSGKTSVGKELAKRLGYEFISTGNIFRAEAAELGITMHELEQLYNADLNRDKAFDEKIVAYVASRNNYLIDSRLAWYFIPETIKIKLVASESKRIERVAARDKVTPEQAAHDINFRENASKKRYLDLYGITEIAPDHIFDYILDTTSLNFEEVVEALEKFLYSKI